MHIKSQLIIIIIIVSSSSSRVCVSVSTAEHKRFVQLLDMRFKDINGYMNEMSASIDKFLQVTETLATVPSSPSTT